MEKNPVDYSKKVCFLFYDVFLCVFKEAALSNMTGQLPRLFLGIALTITFGVSIMPETF